MSTMGIIHPPLEIRTIVEKTAQFVTKNGLDFERKIMANNIKNAKFNFLNSSDLYHPFYKHRLTEYFECVGDATKPYNVLPPQELSILVPEGITSKEHDTIKLAAYFVARYGMHFWLALMKRVIMNPQFEFMKRTDKRFDFFNGLVVVYSKVLMPSEKLKKGDDCIETVLEGFLHALQDKKWQKEKDERALERLEMAMIDWNAFANMEG